MDSAEFAHVPLTISLDCLRSMWYLTLSENEWGGQLYPEIKDGRCQLSCDIKLIEGTGLQQHKDDKFYLGKNASASRRVRIAVTPFYKEVFQVYPLCETEDTINMFFHTHPLLMVRDDNNQGKLAPPSLGDLFAHCILSNYRNYKQNKQLNTCVLISFEGMYVYYILPHKFRQIYERIEQLYKELVNNPSPVEADGYEIGEVPLRVVNAVKAEFFDSMRTAMDAFGLQMRIFLDSQKDLLDTTGAPVIKDTMWSCKACEVEPEQLAFPFNTAIQTPAFRNYARDNVFIQAMRENGFSYDFFPAPFTQDVQFLAPTKANFVANRVL